MNASQTVPVVRLAGPDDLVAAGSVVAAAFLNDVSVSPAYLLQLRDAATRAAQAVLLVAVIDEQVVGTVTYVRGGTPMAELAGVDEVELRMLGVAPVARGRGVADALVRACIERAHAEGVRRIVLSTMAPMTVAQRLYVRLGFVRRPSMDWEPEPGVRLLGYDLAIRPPGPTGEARR